MYRFEHISFLWALIVIVPLFIIIYFVWQNWKKKQLAAYGEAKIVKRMMLNVSTTKPKVKYWFFVIGVVFLFVGLANLQYGTKLESIKRKGSEIMILLDISNSMLAEDLSPNRLDRAKMAIERMLKRVKGDRLGIIVFAGEAYVQLPITTDFSAAKLFLDAVHTDMIPKQGTLIGNAIELAIESFDFESPTTKAIIVVTDGESHDDDPIPATQEAISKGIVVHTIGLGSTEGTPVPVYRNRQKIGYKKDKSGQTILTKLNESALINIAKEGDGIYVAANNARVGFDKIIDELAKLEKKEYDSKMFRNYESRFQIFLSIALVFFIIEFFIPSRKSGKYRIDLFEEEEKNA